MFENLHRGDECAYLASSKTTTTESSRPEGAKPGRVGSRRVGRPGRSRSALNRL